MKAGNFNINDYLEKLYEESASTPMMSGGEGLTDAEGIVIPEQNKKSYDWLKKEYQKGQTEVKVEINMGGAKFEPGYDLQTKLDSVKDFKPGMFGEVKTADMKGPAPKQGEMPKGDSLDAKKESSAFTKGEGDSVKKDENSKTKDSNNNIKNKDTEDKSTKSIDKKPEVKKVDLKTKKSDVPEKPEKEEVEDKEDKEDKDKEDESKTKKNDTK